MKLKEIIKLIESGKLVIIRSESRPMNYTRYYIGDNVLRRDTAVKVLEMWKFKITKLKAPMFSEYTNHTIKLLDF